MNANITGSKKVFTVWTSTDLTEGRGTERPMAYCELEATAKRLAKGSYVQGTDAKITIDEMIRIKDIWYAPHGYGFIEYGTREDVEMEKKLEEERKAAERRSKVLEKARSLGLTEDEIKILGA